MLSRVNAQSHAGHTNPQRGGSTGTRATRRSRLVSEPPLPYCSPSESSEQGYGMTLCEIIIIVLVLSTFAPLATTLRRYHLCNKNKEVIKKVKKEKRRCAPYVDGSMTPRISRQESDQWEAYVDRREDFRGSCRFTYLWSLHVGFLVLLVHVL